MVCGLTRSRFQGPTIPTWIGWGTYLSDPSDRSLAILIGTSECKDDELDDLPAVKVNLASLTHLLHTWRFGLAPRSVVSILNASAPAKIQLEVKKALNDASRDGALDVVLVYYAGHGLLVHDETTKLFLACRDTEQAASRSALPASDLWNPLLDNPIDVKLVVLDCCYSGAALKSFTPTSAMPREVGRTAGSYVVTSTTGSNPAYTSSDAPHTAFTGHLVSVLDRGLPNGKRHLGIDETFREVCRRYQEPTDDDSNNHVPTNPAAQIRHHLSSEDLAWAKNPYYGEIAPEGDLLMDVQASIDSWLQEEMCAEDTLLSEALMTAIRDRLGRLQFSVEAARARADSSTHPALSPQKLGALASALGAARAQVQRHEAIRAAAALRLERASRARSPVSLRALDDDNAVVVERRAALAESLGDVRAVLRSLGR